MYSKVDLAREAIAGAAAAVATALLMDFVHDTRRRGRLAAGRPQIEGEPRTWQGRLAEAMALRLAFRAAMDGSRTISQRVI